MQTANSDQPVFLRFFSRHGTATFLLLGLLLGVLIRLALVGYVSADFLWSFGRWFGKAAKVGAWQFVGLEDFADYNPPYLYLLASGTLLTRNGLEVVKTIPLIFDFAAAWVIFCLARQRWSGWQLPSLAAVLFLFAPSLLANGALWGQCDILPAFFILLTLYALLAEKMTLAGVAYGLALAFKLQAVFFGPVLLLLLLKGRFRLRDAGCGLLAYLATLLPAIAAGRGVWNTLTIYVRQAGKYPQLTIDAANLYTWVVDDKQSRNFLKSAGLCLAGFVILLSLYLILRSGRKLTGSLLVTVSFYFCLVLPFFLPSMHERYFFLADMLAIVYAIYYPRRGWVPLLMGLLSYAMYSHFLFRLTIVPPIPLSCLVAGLLAYVSWRLLQELYPAGFFDQGTSAEKYG